MDTKTCTICNPGKHINNFYKKYSECRDCNSTTRLKRYYENKDNLSNQQRIFYEKNRDFFHLYRNRNKNYYHRSKTLDVYILET